ncbi:MAG: putative Zn-dependent protease [Parasphingorhabdus sp.]|jgi:predicted Zn-dependent protease
MPMLRVFAVLISVAVLLLAGCATNPVTGRQNFVLMTETEEIKLGQDYHNKILSEYTLYDDDNLQAYVSDLGLRLAEKSHRSDIEFKFFVLDSPQVNAFALPGGYIYITRGIMAYMNSEAELAGVLGHEIGHVTARHGVRQQSRGALLGLLGSVAAAATGSTAVGDISNIFGSAFLSGYGRKQELEADRLGAQYLAVSGYSPWAMLDVIGVLKTQEEFEVDKARAEGRQANVYHGLFASHPNNDKRLLEVIGAADNLASTSPPPPIDEAFLNQLNGMTFGQSEKLGVVKNNVFMHKSLDVRIDFPLSWQIQNQPDRLLGASASRDTIVQIALDEADGIISLEEYLTAQFTNLEQGREFYSGDRVGYAGIAFINSPFGQRNARVAAIQHNNWIYVSIGVSKEGLPDNEFYSTINSIRFLQQEEQDSASDYFIDLARVGPGDSYRDFIGALIDEPDIENRLRLLNGHYPDGEPAPGQIIKILYQNN